MPKAITVFEANDGQRFETLAACEQYESTNRSIYLQKLKDEIGYREVPLFNEKRYGAYVVPPVTILTATPRNMRELEEIATVMKEEISPALSIMPGFRINPATNKPYYAGTAEFPMVYSVMIERYRRRKNPNVKLFSGFEFSRLANLCTGHIDGEPEINSYDPNTPTATYRRIPSKPPKPTCKTNPPVRYGKKTPITRNGETKSLLEWAMENNLQPMLVMQRTNSAGWDIERALTTPKYPKRNRAN